ncbi:MAG: HAD hydrolase family protein [Lachnospiraceae bacterium]|nr:HAD hydrolase family protein [Lachnospiraceae bacterium]
MIDGKPNSYIRNSVLNKLQSIVTQTDEGVVPITTRVFHQYSRVRLPTCKYALINNGAVLLINGVIDADWFNESIKLSKQYIEHLTYLYTLLDESEFVFSSLSVCDDMFLCGKFESPNNVMQFLQDTVDFDTCSVYRQGAKIYIIPKAFEKGEAIRRFKERFDVDITISAGDNELDLSMLKESDIFLTSNQSCKEKEAIVVSPFVFTECLLDYYCKISKEEMSNGE